MSDSKKTTWWIFPKDAHTNETIATALSGMNREFASENKLCADGKKRDLWRVPEYSFVSKMLKSKKDLKLDFTPFKSKGQGDPIEWKFTARKKISLEKIKFGSDLIKRSALAAR